jgi:nitrogen fixation protein NifZ
MVGCREEELIGLDEDWIESRFEVRQKVKTVRALSIRGEVKVPAGSRGEVLNLERHEQQGVIYHVHFDCLAGNPLLVPESALKEIDHE